MSRYVPPSSARSTTSTYSNDTPRSTVSDRGKITSKKHVIPAGLGSKAKSSRGPVCSAVSSSPFSLLYLFLLQFVSMCHLMALHDSPSIFSHFDFVHAVACARPPSPASNVQSCQLALLLSTRMLRMCAHRQRSRQSLPPTQTRSPLSLSSTWPITRHTRKRRCRLISPFSSRLRGASSLHSISRFKHIRRQSCCETKIMYAPRNNARVATLLHFARLAHSHL